MSVLMFVCFYYPIGLYENAEPEDQVTERGAFMFLLLWGFFIFTSTFTDFTIAGFETVEAGGNVANILFMLCLMFCGILTSPDSIPRFWIFPYRVSPFTYMTSAMISVAVANTDVVCAANELLQFSPPAGQTCSEFLQDYIELAGGYLQDANATDMCSFCTIGNTNVYLTGSKAYYSER